MVRGERRGLSWGLARNFTSTVHKLSLFFPKFCEQESFTLKKFGHPPWRHIINFGRLWRPGENKPNITTVLIAYGRVIKGQLDPMYACNIFFKFKFSFNFLKTGLHVPRQLPLPLPWRPGGGRPRGVPVPRGANRGGELRVRREQYFLKKYSPFWENEVRVCDNDFLVGGTALSFSIYPMQVRLRLLLLRPQRRLHPRVRGGAVGPGRPGHLEMGVRRRRGGNLPR